MTTAFPEDLDEFQNPTSTDNLDSDAVPHASQHANANDAIEALEAKVGVDGSAVATSLDFKVDAVDTSISDHIADPSAAHAASAISVADSGNDFTATDVEGALAELQSDNEAHLADTTAAHAASAISFSPTGTIAATDVQTAIAEVASEAGSTGDMLDWQYARKSADETVGSSTTLQDDNHLTFAIGASETWVVEYFLSTYSATATPDIKFAISAPSGAAGTHGGIGPAAAVTASTGDGQFLHPSDLTTAVPYGLDGAERHSVHHWAIVRNGANAGNVVLQWAQNVSDANTSRVMTDSFMVARRVA